MSEAGDAEARHRARGDELDGEWLTQYVFADSGPRNSPRAGRDADGLSALAGRLTVADAARYVRFQVHVPYSGDGVRYASVRGLRDSGFTVTLTPSKRIPIHVSVSVDAQWTEEDGRRFDECFGQEERWFEGGDEDE